MPNQGEIGEVAPVSLREITPKNIHAVLALEVTDEQKRVYPRSNGYSIAEGHYPSDGDPVWMRAIYAGETPVGFLMTSEAPDCGEYFLCLSNITDRPTLNLLSSMLNTDL